MDHGCFVSAAHQEASPTPPIGRLIGFHWTSLGSTKSFSVTSNPMDTTATVSENSSSPLRYSCYLRTLMIGRTSFRGFAPRMSRSHVRLSGRERHSFVRRRRVVTPMKRFFVLNFVNGHYGS